MAAPTTRQTAISGILAQPLRSTGSETSLTFDVTASDPWASITTGFAKLNIKSSAEWFSFTGVTVNSSTSVTLTGVTRGLKKNATSTTDAQSANKKDHTIGTPMILVLHSVEINKYAQVDADNTFSGNNTVTGTMAMTSTTQAVLIAQNVTTAQRTALTGVANGLIVYDTTLGEMYQYIGGTWQPFAAGSTQPNASTTVAGKVEIATGAEQIAMTATGGTGAILMVPNDATERLLNGMHNSTATQLRVGYNNTGSRAAEVILYSDATYTGGSVLLQRANSGANATTTLTHRGTGQFTFSAPDGGAFVFSGGFATSQPVYQQFTSGEAITAGMLVYYNNTDNLVYKASKASLITAAVIGQAKTTASGSGQAINIQTGGWLFDGYTGLTDGADYYLDINGGVVTSASIVYNSASVVPVYVGKAVGSTRIAVRMQRVPRRLMGNTIVAYNAATTTITVGFPIDKATFNYSTGGGTTPACFLNGYGWFDAMSSTQGCVGGYYSEFGPTGSSIYSTTRAIYLIDVFDTAGTKIGEASISSNNILITWTDTTYGAGDVSLSYEVTERL